jgi:hypothetical protein
MAKASMKVKNTKGRGNGAKVKVEGPAYDPKQPLELGPEFGGYGAAGQDVAGPMSPAQVLEELQALLADGNLPESQVETLTTEPAAYMVTRYGLTPEQATGVVATVARLYFSTLHKRATEGEAFTQARLGRTMVEAQTRTLEAIAGAVQTCTDLNLILRVAQELTKD